MFQNKMVKNSREKNSKNKYGTHFMYSGKRGNINFVVILI